MSIYRIEWGRDVGPDPELPFRGLREDKGRSSFGSLKLDISLFILFVKRNFEFMLNGNFKNDSPFRGSVA